MLTIQVNPAQFPRYATVSSNKLISMMDVGIFIVIYTDK